MKWPWQKEEIVDTAEFIFTDEPGVFYPLEADHELFTQCIDKIKDILRIWMTQDISFATKRRLEVTDTLVYQIMQTDLKFLGYISNFELFSTILNDSADSSSGSRLMDAFVRIAMQIPIDIQRVITGRFLYAHVWCLQKQINHIDLPSKQDWLGILKEHPWVVYLPFIQELYDEDDIVTKVTELQQATITGFKQTTVVDTPLGGRSS